MSQQAKEAQLRKLRLNLEASAQQQVRTSQITCPPNQTDKMRGHSTHTDAADVDKTLNFDQKIYMFPPHYNWLRTELVEHWQDTLWPLVAWRMAYKAEEFAEYMNAATGLAIAVDSDAVDWSCEQWLKALRKMRGVK